MPHVKEYPQQRKGIKSITHIERGLIIHDGQLHNVGIHWLLRVGEEGRKKINIKFSLQEKNHYDLFKCTQPPGKNVSPVPEGIHLQKTRSHSMC